MVMMVCQHGSIQLITKHYEKHFNWILNLDFTTQTQQVQVLKSPKPIGMTKYVPISMSSSKPNITTYNLQTKNKYMFIPQGTSTIIYKPMVQQHLGLSISAKWTFLHVQTNTVMLCPILILAMGIHGVLLFQGTSICI